MKGELDWVGVLLCLLIIIVLLMFIGFILGGSKSNRMYKKTITEWAIDNGLAHYNITDEKTGETILVWNEGIEDPFKEKE